MITALVISALSFIAAIGWLAFCAALGFIRYERRQAARTIASAEDLTRASRAETDRVREEGKYLLDLMRGEIGGIRAQYEKQIEGLRGLSIDAQVTHVAEIERLNAVHSGSLERLASLLTLGMPVRQEAVVSDGEPDAETRVLNQITNDMIERGVKELKAEYDARNIPVSEAELRDEVRAMMNGVGLDAQTIAGSTLVAVRD